MNVIAPRIAPKIARIPNQLLRIRGQYSSTTIIRIANKKLPITPNS